MVVIITFTIQDAKGKQSTMKIRVPLGFSPDQYVQFAESAAAVISAICDGAIVDISIGIPLDTAGAALKAVANSAADIAEKALFVIRSIASGIFSRMNIPTFREDLTVTGSDDIDMADTDIAALVAVVENGVTGGGYTVQMADRYENDLDEVTYGKETFRRFG